MSTKATYIGGASNSHALSTAIWADCKVLELYRDGGDGFFIMDDLLALGQISLSGAGAGRYAGSAGGYASFENITTPGKVSQIEELGGAVRLTTGAADNFDVTLQHGGGDPLTAGTASGIARVVAASNLKLWYETRVRMGSLGAQNFFVGLVESNQAVDNAMFSDAGALQSKDYIGFAIDGDASDGVFDAVFRKAGQAAQVAQAAAFTVAATSTYFKLGIKYQGRTRDGERLSWYANNVEVGSITTAALAAGTFPSGDLLSPLWSILNSGATQRNHDVDWWALGMEL